MTGTIRIRRGPGVTDTTERKAVYIPQGAEFRASDGDRVVGTIETLEPVTIEGDKNEAVVGARVVDNHANIPIGDTAHAFRPSFASNDASPGKSDGACDWKQATLVATPIALFED
jgi:hypothetical protein